MDGAGSAASCGTGDRVLTGTTSLGTKVIDFVPEQQMLTQTQTLVQEVQLVTDTVEVTHERQTVSTLLPNARDEIQTVTTACADVVAEVQTITTDTNDVDEVQFVSLSATDVDEIQAIRTSVAHADESSNHQGNGSRPGRGTNNLHRRDSKEASAHRGLADDFIRHFTNCRHWYHRCSYPHER